jgi:hypothetical protein
VQPSLVLVTGPMVGVESWLPTADRLRGSGADVQVPDVLSAVGGVPPWRAWTSHLADLIAAVGERVLVGHSAASVLVADLASRVPVRGVIIVDGEIPPARGPVAPATGAFRNLIDSLADQDGRLPPWCDWWRTPARAAAIGVAEVARDPEVFDEFRRGLPHLPLAWFDDEIDLADWQDVPTGYVQTSVFFNHSADDAQRRGWPVQRLSGTHLHPMLRPDETAAAIEAICQEFVAGD